jgi:beta-N-acetylhexosaminidase
MASVIGLLMIALAACRASPAGPAGGQASGDQPAGSVVPSASAGPTPTATPTSPDAAALALRRMSPAQRAGQLIMVGNPAAGGASAARAISRYHVGNVMLTGRSRAGVAATARVSARLQREADQAATSGVRLLVATDQEGGAVQVLTGPGFSPIPEALTQGGWASSTLRLRARRWGQQLRAAGVRLDLAPVADVVPTSGAAGNAPIGAYGRQFGADPDLVAGHAAAFAAGLADAGVLATAKHFPGLGRVTANTDTSASVVDRVTTTGSGSVRAFTALADDVPVVMIASATFRRIDPANLACFSSVVITDLLRGRLGFQGLVISDDLGRARQVAAWRPGSRAVRFVAAGGDLVLTVDPSVAPAMALAVADRARADPRFRRQVDASVLRVLRAKASAGLL